MRAALAFVILLAVSIIAAGTYSASAIEKLLPQDEPNFKPQITKVIADGKAQEIVEFKSKLAVDTNF
jgi:hypothetical protein